VKYAALLCIGEKGDEAVTFLNERLDPDLRSLPQGAVQDVLSHYCFKAEGRFHQRRTCLDLVAALLDGGDKRPAELMSTKEAVYDRESSLDLESLELLHGCLPPTTR
jgi:hypothetical protein